jgi:hypothetical protein
MGYLIENDCFALLQDSGRKVYIHTIVGGGDTLHDTATGFVSTAKATNVPLVLWENEHFGLLQSASGKQFVDSQTYADNASRVVGRVVLTARNADTFGADLKKMNTARMTMAEVRESDKFNVMEKQRIKVVFRDLFEQLDQVKW